LKLAYEEESFNRNTSTSANYGYNIASALQIRLDSRPILEDIELFLRGCKLIVHQDDKGNISTQNVLLGRAKANDLGIQSMLNYVSCLVNPQVVQGNFPSDAQGHCTMYEAFIEEIHIDLATQLVVNCYDWGVRDEDITVICDFITKLCIPFLTRLIDNKERESYDQTVKHIESNTMREGKGFSFFGGGSNG
jgi:hypothetical protein